MTPKTRRTVILLSCSARKAANPLPAAELYQGTLFKASLAWAQQQKPDAIYILSAKHHLVAPDRVLQPYDLTLNDMPIAELRLWSDAVLEQLKSVTDIELDRFIILAGDKYRRFLMPNLRDVELPLEGMRIGEQVQFLQRQIQAAGPAHDATPANCADLHGHFAALPRYRFPFDPAEIPKNGIYILFEAGEYTHGTDRIVRIGTHRGQDQLPARLKEHFLTENKDRSIFRKNIGRALLNREQSPLAEQWEIELASRAAREQHGSAIDRAALEKIEHQVSAYMRSNLSFSVIEVPEKSTRLRLEAGLIATVNRCADCSPSKAWLGKFSPKPQIARSGLWLVQGLDAEPLTQSEWNAIKQSRTADLASSGTTHFTSRTAPQAKSPGQPGGTRKMSRKYAPLEEYLRSRHQPEISLTFKEIESILGQPLPRSARDVRQWWGNQKDTRARSQAAAWMNGGYRVDSVALGAHGWVRFARITEPED